VAVIGPNGAGKSTAIKLLIGELTASQGVITKHPNMRLAYVAQVRFRIGFWGLRLGLSVHHTLIYMSSTHTQTRVSLQHAFHHLEKHLNESPAQYIMWRFAGNEDKESLELLDKKADKDDKEVRSNGRPTDGGVFIYGWTDRKGPHLTSD